MQCLTRFIVTPAFVLMVALVSCGFPSISTVGPWPTNTGAVNTPVAYVVLQATATPISTLPAIGAVPPKGKVHITTTSDWTNLRLVSGGTWVNPANMSSSLEATVASIKENLIILSQPMARAQAGKEVEITLDVLFSGLNPSGQVVLDIERGFIGSTRVEVFAYTDGQPVLLRAFLWDKINKDNGNVTEVQIPAAELITPPTTVTSTGTPTRSAPAVDATTLNGKVIFGYQGWFSCPNDGSRFGMWVHWTRNSQTFNASNLMVDFWPDVSELPADERCATEMQLPDGSTAQVFSNYNPRTIDRHFQWMEQYSIDGVASQRFVANLDSPRVFDFRNQVLRSVRSSAEAHGRVFYVEYASAGEDGAALFASLKNDWAYLVDVMRITDSPAYLHDNGLPVLGIYGLGISNNPGTSAEYSLQIVNYFKSTAPPKYRVTLMGGVPSYWRAGTRDAFAGPAWAAVYRSFDIISPWAVGRYTNDAGADQYQREVIAPDLVEAARHHARYMPVIFPGFSWTNLFPDSSLNQIPRQCGRFYWHQAFNAVSAGSKIIFVAMFDEVDEGTAMFKLAPTKAQLPLGAKLVPLDIDGCALPSDWYLRLGGATGKLLRGEIKLTPDIPIKPY